MDDRSPADTFPPGEFLRDELEARGWTQSQLASIMGRPAQVICEIINGRKRITPETAKGLGDALGTSAQLWLNLESAYRLSLSQSKNEDVSHRAKIFTVAPVKQLIKRGWIKDSTSTIALESELKRFYGTADLDNLPEQAFAARASADYGPGQRAWLRRASLLAKAVNAAKFDPQKFVRGLDRLHRLVADEYDIRQVPRFLAGIGVRMVIVEHLKGTRIDGAALWLDDESPAIALSMRFDRIDSFWHTLAHELIHIKYHDRSLDSDLVGKERQLTAQKDAIEQRADSEAADFLIPSEEMERFLLRMQERFSKDDINRFANRIQVHPGIIAGQLHHRLGNYSHHREMLVPVRQQVIEAALSDGWGVSPPI
jgi:HTH-type transcriptional regulator/antitoxin HigA